MEKLPGFIVGTMLIGPSVYLTLNIIAVVGDRLNLWII